MKKRISLFSLMLCVLMFPASCKDTTTTTTTTTTDVSVPLFTTSSDLLAFTTIGGEVAR